MITLLILYIIWGLISAYRINKQCNKKGIDFHITGGTFWDYLGFTSSVCLVIMILIVACITYLP